MVKVICSTPTLGRDDVITERGCWVLDHYMKNPVWLAFHNPDWPVSRSLTMKENELGQLISDVKFPPAGVSERSDEILGLIRAGVINAASTGFEILESEPINPRDPSQGIRINKAELQEVSWVSIPAVPDALVIERSGRSRNTAMQRHAMGHYREIAARFERQIQAERFERKLAAEGRARAGNGRSGGGTRESRAAMARLFERDMQFEARERAFEARTTGQGLRR